MHIEGPEDMPVCPGCGNPIEAHESSEIILAFGYQALVFQSCYDEIEEGD